MRFSLYDWSNRDVWVAISRFGYEYNRLYDLYYQAGLKIDQMRVASPFNDYSKDALNLYRVIDPEIWTGWSAGCGGPTLVRSMVGPKPWAIAASLCQRGIPGSPTQSSCWIRCPSGFKTIM